MSFGHCSSLRMKNVFWGLAFWLMKTLLTLSYSQIIPEKHVFRCRLPFLSVARVKFCSHTPSLCNEHRASLQGVTQEMSFIQAIEELSNSTYFVV